MPHLDAGGLLQAITYRLADSLPLAAIERIESELTDLPPNRRETERRRRIDAWIDAGHGSCVLRNPDNARLVVDGWRRFDGERYDLIAWVVMPNHVHLLIRAYEGAPLGKIVQSRKSFTGRRLMDRAHSAGTRVESGDRIWMREYRDRRIRNAQHFRNVVSYIHENPVKAALVGRAEEWEWSSCLEFRRAELELGDPRKAKSPESSR